MMGLNRVILTGVCAVSLVAAVSTQAGGPGVVTDAPALERKLDSATVERLLRLQDEQEVAVRLVLLPASVEDKRGRIVTGLTAGDFKLTDESVPQEIKYFSVESDEPVSIAFVLDVSGSMRQSGKMDSAKEAIRFFVDQLRPQDRFALICFADDQVSWVTKFTSDHKRFVERLMVQEGYGQTALNDAVAAIPKLVDESTTGRKAIVLITDGVDNASKLTLEQSIVTARKVEVPIFTVGFSSLPWEDRKQAKDLGFNMAVLQLFADETGGALFVVQDPDELKEAVARISTDLRHQYLIGYTPGLAHWDGSFRSVQLQARNGRYVVRTRKGYYANP
jgi:Ca-activated chloride channel family protein